jgi:hypothetical protein
VGEDDAWKLAHNVLYYWRAYSISSDEFDRDPFDATVGEVIGEHVSIGVRRCFGAGKFGPQADNSGPTPSCASERSESEVESVGSAAVVLHSQHRKHRRRHRPSQ